MRRNTFGVLKGILLSVFSLWAGSIIGQTTYYVSNSGNDALAGTSSSAAWKTISKVNTINLTAGDFVLFQAGGTWRETLNVKPGASGAGHRIHYGRYGVGKNPQILGSNKAENWTATGTTNIWQSATSISNPRAGGLGYPAEIFFVAKDSTTWGDFQTYSTTFSNLTRQCDWTWNANVLYVYSAVDPDLAYDAVEAPQRDICMSAVNTACSYIEVNGIDLHYAKISGYRNGYPEMRGATDLTFKNCHIGYIGEKSGTAAYGVEAFHSNFLVDSCVFSDCGRRAISMNFYVAKTAGNEIYIDSVIVRNSRFKRGQHTTSLDFGVETACVGDTFLNIYYYNNIVDDHEIAMTGNDRTSNQVYFQPSAGYMSNVYIYNNLFIQATARNILITRGDVFHVWNNTIVSHNPNITTSPYSNVSFGHLVKADYRNNITFDNLPDDARNNFGVLMEYSDARYLLRDYNMYFQAHENASRRGFTGGINGYYNMSAWSSYRSTNPSFDAHSPIPQNPAFINYDNFDYKLSASSAAKGAGTPIPMVKTDLLGNPRNPVNPSIGAYEYYIPNSTLANIVSFSMAAQTGTATINSTNHTVTLQVAFGTNLSSLTPTIGISPGASINPATGVARNFNSPVTYTVTAANGNTQLWTITVTVKLSTDASILSFSLPAQTGAATINATNHTVTVEVAYGTSLTNLIPTIGVSPGASINPLSGIARDFTNPIIYTVTAQDLTSIQAWTITVKVKPCSETNITSFSLPAQTGAATINATNHTVTVEVAYGTSLTNLIPTIGVSPGASINPLSGIARDFTNPIIYTVTAQDLTSIQAWTITVKVKPCSETNITSFSLPAQTGAATINATNHTVAIQVAYGTNLTSLSPTIGLSPGATISPASGVARNFTSPLAYLVTAQDGTSTQSWTVTVTVKAAAEANILSFSLPTQTGAATINTVNHTVFIQVAYATNLSSLIPTIGISSGASINPLPGVARNFTSPVIYAVIAQDGITQQNWTITVTLAAQPVNNPPVVNINYQSNAIRGLVYLIDASKSYDLDNQPLTYKWVVPVEISASSLTGSSISIMATENALNKVYTIKLTVSDGVASIVKNIDINVTDYNAGALQLPAVKITASSFEPGNIPANINDNNLNTRWSADGDNQWLLFELTTPSALSHFTIGFHSGKSRTSTFDIYASADNVSWDLLVEHNISCGFSTNLQLFKVPANKTANSYKFVKLVGHMNSAGTWNSYTEFKPFGFSSVLKDAAIGEVENNNENAMEVYPNPASDEVFIKAEVGSQVRIIDMTGATIYEQDISTEISKIDYNFRSGVYFVQLKYNNKVQTQKLIIR